MDMVVTLGCPSGGPEAARCAIHLEGVALVEQIVAPTGGLGKAARRGREGVPVVRGCDGYVRAFTRWPSSLCVHH